MGRHPRLLETRLFLGHCHFFVYTVAACLRVCVRRLCSRPRGVARYLSVCILHKLASESAAPSKAMDKLTALFFEDAEEDGIQLEGDGSTAAPRGSYAEERGAELSECPGGEVGAITSLHS